MDRPGGPSHLPAEDLQVAGDGPDAAVEVWQVELLVGRVQIIVGKSEAHHHAGNSEIPVEDADDRDRAARPDVHRLFAEGLL